jgi:hypothetical protein
MESRRFCREVSSTDGRERGSQDRVSDGSGEGCSVISGVCTLQEAVHKSVEMRSKPE